MNSPIKYHGGKHYLARKIADLMPPHTHYVEPYFGSGAVLLAKERQGSEVVNDLCRDLTNFWRVLQSQHTFRKFKRMCEATPFSEIEWHESQMELAEDYDLADEATKIRRAWAYFVHCRQSMAGRRRCFSPITRVRTRRGMNAETSAWLSAIEGLAEVHGRLQRVVILCQEATKVIERHDGEKTLFYLDPPYVHETRSAVSVYSKEMTLEQHTRLLLLIQKLKGMVLISGYDHPLYNSLLSSWWRVEFDVPNNAASGQTKDRKREIVWCNFRPQNAAATEVAS